MKKLVSVLVISYNSSSTIVETLNSVLLQDYKNIELIVSDDASSDNTIEIVNAWKQQEFRKLNVKIVTSEKNTGVPENCNRGLAHCSGIAVKIIAADDILLPNAISSYYRFYEKDKSNIYMSKVELFGSNSDIQTSYCQNSYDKIKEENQYRNLLISNFLIAPAIGLIDMEIYHKYGGYDTRFKCFEDYPMFLRLAKNGYGYRLIEEELVRYRISSSSLGNGMSKGYMNSLSLYFFKEKIHLLLRERMYFTTLKQFIRYSIMYIKSL